MKPLSYTQMTFEEFSAAAISPYQLEALERWEIIANKAFQYFELEGNRVISVDALAQVKCITFLFHSRANSHKRWVILANSCLGTYFQNQCVRANAISL